MPDSGLGFALNIFWSSDPAPGNEAFAIRFGPGHMNAKPLDDISQWTRCVRDADPPHPPTGTISTLRCGDANGDGSRNITDAIYVLTFLFNMGPSPCVVRKSHTRSGEPFQINAETILGIQSGLEWERVPSSELFTWEAALDAAKARDFAGHTDWRLPNVVEMASLLEFVGTNGSFLNNVIQPMGAPFPGEGPTCVIDPGGLEETNVCKVFWTATTYIGSPPVGVGTCEGWKVDFVASGRLIHNTGNQNLKSPDGGGVVCRGDQGSTPTHLPARIWLVRGGVSQP